MTRILVSNDDSVHAAGIAALARALRRVGEVTVVAPLEEKSTTGHSLTIHKPLRLIPMPMLGERFYGVSGSPADCVYLGIREVLGAMPDIVVSGINRGANLGQDVYYSGTVSAAREACILGLPALAVSLSIDFKALKREDSLHYETAGHWAQKAVQWILERGLPKHTLMNLNVPDLPARQILGVKMGKQGFRHYSGSVLKRRDHRGKDYFWVGGEYRGFAREPGSDCLAVAERYAALTPLKLDTTDYDCLGEWEDVLATPKRSAKPRGGRARQR